MTNNHERQVAQALYEALPIKTLPEPGAGMFLEVAAAASDAMLEALTALQVPDPQAVVLAETLSGYVYGTGGRYGNLDELTEQASFVLHQALGGVVLNAEQGMMLMLPPGTPITLDALLALVRHVYDDRGPTQDSASARLS
jgi:hypothetical protein